MNDPDFRLSFEHLEEYVPARRNIWVGSKREVLAIPSRGAHSDTLRDVIVFLIGTLM